jgi:hypothetical protein
MRYLLILLFLASCAKNQYIDNSDLPNTTMLVDKEMSAMSRSQIINAIQECQSGNLRPVMVYSRRKINGQVSEVVVDVSCAPKFGM